MKLSKRSEYGIKAAVRLAIAYGNGYLQSREIADQEGLPAKFLESILLALRSSGLLESKVGAGGGYRLTRSPEDIPVAEVIGVLEAETESPAPSPNGDLPGHNALRLIYARLHKAIQNEIGDLSLGELTQLSEKGKGSGHSKSPLFCI